VHLCRNKADVEKNPGGGKGVLVRLEWEVNSLRGDLSKNNLLLLKNKKLKESLTEGKPHHGKIPFFLEEILFKTSGCHKANVRVARAESESRLIRKKKEPKTPKQLQKACRVSRLKKNPRSPRLVTMGGTCNLEASREEEGFSPGFDLRDCLVTFQGP